MMYSHLKIFLGFQDIRNVNVSVLIAKWGHVQESLTACDWFVEFGFYHFSRYADFLVHEIAQDGSVVQLTNLSIPVEKV